MIGRSNPAARAISSANSLHGPLSIGRAAAATTRSRASPTNRIEAAIAAPPSQISAIHRGAVVLPGSGAAAAMPAGAAPLRRAAFCVMMVVVTDECASAAGAAGAAARVTIDHDGTTSVSPGTASAHAMPTASTQWRAAAARRRRQTATPSETRTMTATLTLHVDEDCHRLPSFFAFATSASMRSSSPSERRAPSPPSSAPTTFSVDPSKKVSTRWRSADLRAAR